MAADDFAMLSNHLVEVDLPRGHQLTFPERRTEYCWFLEEGIASLVSISSGGREIEAGIVGPEGMIDVGAILGADSSPFRCFIQVAGRGYRLPLSFLRHQIDSSLPMRTLLNRFAFDCFVDVSYTAVANATFTVEERLARWLLMCGDRLNSLQITITHEFLSVMLNVRRAGVTEALQRLEATGLLEASRGLITLTNRSRLEQLVQDAYRPIRRDGHGDR